MKSQPLLVHLIFHPESEQASNLASYVHHQLNGNTIVPGLRVPTIFCPSQHGQIPPTKLRLDFAERNFLAVLADDHLNIHEDWCTFIADVRENAQSSRARFVPIQLSENSWPLDPRLNDLSFAKAYLQPYGPNRNDFVVRRIVVELCRYLSNLEGVERSEFEAPITLFLSHAKADINLEPKVTQCLIEALKGDQPIEAWVDSGEIASGSKFAEAIEFGVQRSSLLAVLTDAYATREWCREEILLAKEHQRPVAVVDALSSYEVRSFPYLGNVPRLRWDGDPQKCIDMLLKESLRNLHDLARLEQCRQSGDRVFARSPELATLVGMDPNGDILYPDPPVGVAEAKRLSKAGIKITTPFQRLAETRSLNGKAIALSMSESTDLANEGFDATHLEGCMLEVSRYLLLKGATLAYGGHLGAEDFTQKLFELVHTHNNSDNIPSFDRIVNHRAWPLPRLSVAELSILNHVSKSVQLPRPADIDERLHSDFTINPKFFPGDKSAAHRYAWARGMTEMRSFQADRTQSGVVARIVIGGTFGPTFRSLEDGTHGCQWYASRMPGVLEEIVLSVRAKQPVFLVGAFGGVARLVIDLIRGCDRVEGTWDFQKGVPFSKELKEMYAERGIEWEDYPEIVEFLRSKGFEGLNPLLDTAEQFELFETLDQSRIIELILIGLSRIDI